MRNGFLIDRWFPHRQNKFRVEKKIKMVNKSNRGHGGKRPGAGRPPGALNRVTVVSNAAAARLPYMDDPKRFLTAVMDQPGITMRVRLAAAKALLPFCE